MKHHNHDEWIEVKVTQIIRESEQAVLVEFENEEIWLPLSQVEEIHRDDDPPRLVITKWIATKKGMV